MSTGCPFKALSDLTHYIRNLYWHYKMGHMKSAGGLDDQEAWYVEAMRTIGDFLTDAELEASKDKNG